jgi:outer membrane biosynthesis protein TonB
VPTPTVPETVPPTTAAPTTTQPPATAPPATEAPPSTTAPVPQPAPGPAPVPAATAALPAAAPQPAPAASVTAIGDSIMVSAAGALRDRLGPTGFIDALMNRQFRDAAAVIRAMRDAGTLGSVVVVHLGTNGPVVPADIDSLVAEVPAAVPVLLVNVRSHTAWAASVNQVLAEAPARHPRVKVVDWYAVSEGHREWFQSDGTHFRTMSGPGANAYADLLVGSVPPPPAPAPAPPPPALPVTDPAASVPPPADPATTVPPTTPASPVPAG